MNGPLQGMPVFFTPSNMRREKGNYKDLTMTLQVLTNCCKVDSDRILV